MSSLEDPPQSWWDSTPSRPNRQPKIPGMVGRKTHSGDASEPEETGRLATAAVLYAHSVQHFVLAFFSDHLLELRHNLVPSRHHRFHFILGEIVRGFFC